MEGAYYDDKETKLDAWAQEMLRKYGWYVHFVQEDPDFPNEINYHTHGLTENFNHPDLQICFPLSTEVAHGIFSQIVDLIREGAEYTTGRKYTGILNDDFRIGFIEAMECGRKVLRIIFPNQSGTYEGKIFSSQFELTGLQP